MHYNGIHKGNYYLVTVVISNYLSNYLLLSYCCFLQLVVSYCKWKRIKIIDLVKKLRVVSIQLRLIFVVQHMVVVCNDIKELYHYNLCVTLELWHMVPLRIIKNLLAY
jgi:hypothetical protein